MLNPRQRCLIRLILFWCACGIADRPRHNDRDKHDDLQLKENVYVYSDGKSCSLHLATYDQELPDAHIDHDNEAWNYNLRTTICALEELVAAKQVSFYYPTEGTAIALMRYGRNIGFLPAGKNKVEHDNDVDVLIEVSQGKNRADVERGLVKKMAEYGHKCEIHAHSYSCHGKTSKVECVGTHAETSERTHTDLKLYTTKMINGTAYANQNCYLGSFSKSDLLLSHIHNVQENTYGSCAFLPAKLRVPCPTDGVQLMMSIDDLDFRPGNDIVIPDEFPKVTSSEKDLQQLKKYADILEKHNTLNFAQHLSQRLDTLGKQNHLLRADEMSRIDESR